MGVPPAPLVFPCCYHDVATENCYFQKRVVLHLNPHARSIENCNFSFKHFKGMIVDMIFRGVQRSLPTEG